MTTARRPLLVVALAAAVMALVASAAVAVDVLDRPSSRQSTVRSGASSRSDGLASGSPRRAPSLPGTVVKVELWDLGGPMIGPRNGMMDGRYMRLSADHAVVPHGAVSFLVTNGGSINHEMVVLPDDHVVGARPMGGDARIDEAGSLGEASRTGGKGAGKGIVPDATGWVTVTLAPGEYELVCNLPHHYTAGMHTQLTVT